MMSLVVPVMALCLAPAAAARVGEVVIGAGARFTDDGTGTDVGVAVAAHGALQIDSFLDLNLDLFGNLDALTGPSHWMEAVTLGFALHPPIPGPLMVEAGVSAGAFVAGNLDDLHPLYTYHAAVGIDLLFMHLRLSYVAAFETPFEDSAGTPRPAFGRNILLGVGVGL